jgi:hypothetical protein
MIAMEQQAKYWIYEDFVVHTATVHRGECRYCNHGQGRGHGRDPSGSRWTSCSSASENAIRPVLTRNNSLLRKCSASPCRDDIAPAWLR